MGVILHLITNEMSPHGAALSEDGLPGRTRMFNLYRQNQPSLHKKLCYAMFTLSVTFAEFLSETENVRRERGVENEKQLSRPCIWNVSAALFGNERHVCVVFAHFFFSYTQMNVALGWRTFG